MPHPPNPATDVTLIAFAVMGVTIAVFIDQRRVANRRVEQSKIRLQNLVDWLDHSIVW